MRRVSGEGRWPAIGAGEVRRTAETPGIRAVGRTARSDHGAARRGAGGDVRGGPGAEESGERRAGQLTTRGTER